MLSLTLFRRALQPLVPSGAPSAAFIRRAFLQRVGPSAFSSSAASFLSSSLCSPRQLRGPLLSPLPAPRACGAAAPLGGGAAGGAVRGISTRRRRIRKMNKHRFQKRKKKMRNLNAKNLRTK